MTFDDLVRRYGEIYAMFLLETLERQGASVAAPQDESARSPEERWEAAAALPALQGRAA